MASPRDHRHLSPIRNALLKWQLRQDQKRIGTAQPRLMRIDAPSSLERSSNRDYHLTAQRRRIAPHHDTEEDALMSLIKERDDIETTSLSQFFKPSKLPYESKLRRPERPEPSSEKLIENVHLRPTGQKLNAVGDFYSPVRPQQVSLYSSSSGLRQNLAISRIKAPTPKRIVEASPRKSLAVEQMKTPERWRTNALQSNQNQFTASDSEQWEEEDARQADRLLKKAAGDGDSEALWKDLFYRTKDYLSITKQGPEQLGEYSTSANLHALKFSGSSSYRDNSLKDLRKCDDGMPSRELSISKQSTMQQSYAGYSGADSKTPTFTQTLSEILASMEEDKDDRESDAGHGNNDEGASDGGRKTGFYGNESGEDSFVVRIEAALDADTSRWSFFVVVTCLVIGTTGFYVEELLNVIGLFSSRLPLILTREEQERMRGRVHALQQEVEDFQLLTLEMDVKSQAILLELRHHTKKMQKQRENYRNMVANEMQELRQYIRKVAHQQVEEERESFKEQLEELMRINQTMIHDRDRRNEALAELAGEVAIETSSEDNFAHDSTSALSGKVDDKQVHLLLANDPQCQIDTLAATQQKYEVLVSAEKVLDQLDDVQLQPEQELALVHPQSHLDIDNKVVHPVYVDEVAAEHMQISELTTVLERERNEIRSVTPNSKGKAIAMSPQNASAMTLDKLFLLIGIMFLVACVLLRVYNIYCHKKWFEKRRRRRNQRALLQAQHRARVMAEYKDNSEQWNYNETDSGIEEVSLMTPERDTEELEHQSFENDMTLYDNGTEQFLYSSAAADRPAMTERAYAGTHKSNHNRGSLQRRSTWQRRHGSRIG